MVGSHVQGIKFILYRDCEYIFDNYAERLFEEGPPFTESRKVFGRIMEMKTEAEQEVVLLLF